MIYIVVSRFSGIADQQVELVTEDRDAVVAWLDDRYDRSSGFWCYQEWEIGKRRDETGKVIRAYE